MEKRPIRRYLLFFVISVGFIVLAGILNGSEFIMGLRKERINFSVYFIGVAIYFCFGLVIGLEHLMREIKKGKTPWHFNFPRFLIIGIPTFILALGVPTLYCFNFMILPRFMLVDSYVPYYSAVVFGYALMSSFKRTRVLVNKEN